MRCPECATENPTDFVFCMQCGARLAAQPAVQAVGGASPDVGEWSRSEGAIDAPAGGAARLRVEQGSVDAREFVLDKPVLEIGRRMGNDIVIHDTNVSRQHARLVREVGGFAIEDTNSANGTLVNDERVEGSRILRDGDVIRIGDAVFVFDVARVEPAAADQPPGGWEPVAPSEPSVETAAAMSDEPESPMMAPGPTGSRPPASVGELSDSSAAALGEQPAAEPATAVERSGVEALETVRTDLSALSGDLAALISSLGGLTDRIDGIERSVAQASQELGPLAKAARGPEAESLRELGGMLAAVQAAGGPEQLQPTLDILDQLAEQPRDIELLLKLSQQAPTLRELARLHLRLAAAAPTIRAALDHLVR